MMTNEQEIKDIVYKFGERVFQDFGKEEIAALTPERVNNYLNQLTAYSALLEEELGDLEIHKASSYLEFRKEYKSNVDATMAYEATIEGLREIKLKRVLKSVDKIIAACKHTLRRYENQSFNRY